MTATSPYLNRPLRTESQAVVERENREAALFARDPGEFLAEIKAAGGRWSAMNAARDGKRDFLPCPVCNKEAGDARD